MDQLQQYIIAQEQAGFSEQQIRQAMVRNGYAQPEIDAAFRSLGPAKADPIVHEYVEQYARQGYSAVQIFSLLRQQGYAADKIRRAINDVFGKGAVGQGHSIAVFLVLALLVGAGGFYFLSAPGPEPYAPGGVVVLSPPEIISQVLLVADQQGKERALGECRSRLSGRDRDLCILDVAIRVSDKAVCEQVADVELRDTCLMSFIEEDFDYVCTRVKLADQKITCDKLRALRQSGV